MVCGMCHDPDATPPAIPDLPGLTNALGNAPGDATGDAPADPGPAYAVTAADCTLTSTDGTVFAAHRAHRTDYESSSPTAGPPSPRAILILPDNRGLTGFYRALAGQLAARGHHVLAVDYYARTAGTDLAARAAGFDPMRHLSACTRDTLVADIDAALADLRGHARDVFALGFCFGGRLAFLAADARFGLAGVAGFYGFPGELFGVPGPTQLAAGFTAPVLGLFGQDDAGITPGHLAEFDQALAAAGVAHAIVSYPGVGHSFFEEHADPEFVPFAAPPGGYQGPPEAAPRAHAVADAWHRVVAFIERAGEPGV